MHTKNTGDPETSTSHLHSGEMAVTFWRILQNCRFNPTFSKNTNSKALKISVFALSLDCGLKPLYTKKFQYQGAMNMWVRTVLAAIMPLLLVYALDFMQERHPYAAVIDEASLHELASMDDTIALKQLLDNGADANVRQVGGITPLHIAAYYDHADTAGLLVKYGGNLNARQEKWRWTPLHVAAERGAVATVALLIESGAEINSWDLDGWTPLHVAADEGHVEIVKVLLTQGASVNARDDAGNAPLHRAAENGHVDTAALLIEKGADVNALNDDNQTPLCVADICDQKETICLLRIHGAVK